MDRSTLPASRPSPRGDSLCRAVVEALVSNGYEPVGRQSTGATSCVTLRRQGSAAVALAHGLQLTHLPARHCFLLEWVRPGPALPASVGRRIYWYYQAYQPADCARIAAGLAASITRS